MSSTPWTCAQRHALCQTRNREFAAREPLSCGPEPRDDRGRDRYALQFDRILRVAPGPYPRLAAFDGKLAADRDAMRHVKARAPECADLGGDVGDVVELGRLEKAGLGVDQRNSHDAEGRAQLIRPHAQGRFEQQPDAPIEKFEEMAVERGAGGVEMPPSACDPRGVEEFAQPWSVFLRGGLRAGEENPASAPDVKSHRPPAMGGIRTALSRNSR